MEASLFIALLAVALAFGFGFFVCSHAFERAQLRGLSAGFLGFGAGVAAGVLRNGFRPLLGISGYALRVRSFRLMVDELAGILRTRGYVTNPRAFGSVVLVLLAFVGLAAFLASSSVVCAAAFLLCAVLVLGGFARTAKERREAAFREEIPDVIRSLIVCFGAGMTLHQAAEHVASEFEGPTKAMFEELARILEMGGSTGEALLRLKDGALSDELAFVAVALDVQHKSGGGVVPILESAKEAAQEEMDLRRSMRVQTAQARLSARIVTIMPFVLVALFSLMSEGFLEPFFESAAGLAMLCVALIMQAAGVIAVRQMLKVS